MHKIFCRGKSWILRTRTREGGFGTQNLIIMFRGPAYYKNRHKIGIVYIIKTIIKFKSPKGEGREEKDTECAEIGLGQEGSVRHAQGESSA